MRTLPASNNDGSTSTRTIVVFALLLFAISGLISGFAVGAFVRPKIGPLSHADSNNIPGQQKTSTPGSTTTSHPVKLGYPVIDTVNDSELADGTTVYTFSAHAVDQSIDKGHGKPVYASGILCRLWIIPNSQDPLNIPLSRLTSPSTLSSPFPGETQGLTFTSNSQQVQPSNAHGSTTWTYTISTSVEPGKYYLLVLTDWQGLHYNWSWAVIKIKKADG